MSDVPDLGSLWFKRYPILNVCIVRVVLVDGDQVTFVDDDDTDRFCNYDPDQASTLSLEEFNRDYHILGEAS